jgi:hypothetical protein
MEVAGQYQHMQPGSAACVVKELPASIDERVNTGVSHKVSNIIFGDEAWI